MDEYGITVWRFHDYIHSGIPYKDDYIDGIFYGLAKETGWDDAVINNNDIGPISQRLYDTITGIQWGKVADNMGWTVPVKD